MIHYKSLKEEDLSHDFLKDFNRYQETNQIVYKNNADYIIKQDHFVDHWDEAHKARVIGELKSCIITGGAVIGAFDKEALVGFANIEGKKFGSRNQYFELPYIHVSQEKRGHGIGKKLFEHCCESAIEKGAEKLYIGAHPAVETQQFYRSLGCTYAEEINEEIFNREPLDIQLEYRL
ncbi:GNAT family N-acetyltransferase [Pseudalkalibacillus sp. Hm43]|uniref:GNAT family N-acetyltransferase n=1 Tax=Pseudalkalibacillus sp. Hm43 TaxID=3450742 RepID=UPI003F43C5A9